MNNFTITVVATDSGRPEPFNSTAVVTIISNPPDNFFSPELDQDSYTASLRENSAAGTVVLDFTVTDGDEGPASEIGTATIFGADAAFFTVMVTGPNSGQIRSK